MTLRIQNFILAALFAFLSLFWAQSLMQQNPMSGGSEFFEYVDSGVFADNSLTALEKTIISPENAPECCNATNTGRAIEFNGQFYSADGFKFSKSYYEYLYNNGRPAPFLQAREVLNSNPKVMPDPQGAAGYFRYEGTGLEMIYNPTTGQVGHIQPLR